MVMISMAKLTFVFPVPVTAFNHTMERLIKIIPNETTRITGIPISINDWSCPNKEKKINGLIFSKITIKIAHSIHFWIILQGLKSKKKVIQTNDFNSTKINISKFLDNRKTFNLISKISKIMTHIITVILKIKNILYNANKIIHGIKNFKIINFII